MSSTVSFMRKGQINSSSQTSTENNMFVIRLIHFRTGKTGKEGDVVIINDASFMIERNSLED